MLSAILLAALAGLAAADEVEVASPVALATATTLMGTVFVIMCLYYLFNWPDPDIRRYSYEVVSSTVSIFCAVLMFQSVQNAIEVYVIGDGGSVWKGIIVNFTHRFFWLFVLQFSLALISKVILHTDAERVAIIGKQDDMHKIEVNLKCWGVLLAHITGFSSINAWGTVQQTAFFSQNWFISWLVIPACVLTNIPILMFTQWAREKVTQGESDEEDALETRWIEEVGEAENDIVALGLSFLTVQSVKFAICGELPDVDGEESPAMTYGHTASDCLFLYLFGVICIPIFCYFVVKSAKVEEDEENEYEEEEKREKLDKKVLSAFQTEKKRKEEEEKKEAAESEERMFDQIIVTWSMGMAWSFFYGTKWAIGATPLKWNDDATCLCLSEAVVVSVVCFFFIFILDKMADADWSGPLVDKCLISVIGAIGILVGFSWEQTFDASVAALSSRTSNPVFMKVALALACSIVAVPAWRNYMLPVIVHKGWRYGFIAHQATQYIHPENGFHQKEDEKQYMEHLKHFITGHKLHTEDPLNKQHKEDRHPDNAAIFKNRMRMVLLLQLAELDFDKKDEDAIPYTRIEDMRAANVDDYCSKK